MNNLFELQFDSLSGSQTFVKWDHEKYNRDKFGFISERVFTENVIIDEKLSAEDIAKRLKEYEKSTPQFVEKSRTDINNVYNIPYMIPYKLKDELLTAVWIREKVLHFHEKKNRVHNNEKKESSALKQKLRELKEQRSERIQVPHFPANVALEVLPYTQDVFFHEIKQLEKSRKEREFYFCDLCKRQFLREQTQKERETDCDLCKRQLFREHSKKYVHVLQELDDLLWSPVPNSSKLSVFGMLFKESVDEIKDTCESFNVPFNRLGG